MSFASLLCSGFGSSAYSSERMGMSDRKGARWKVTYKKGEDEAKDDVAFDVEYA